MHRPCLVRVEDIDMVRGVRDEHLAPVRAVLDGRDAGAPLARRAPCRRLREAEPGDEGGCALVRG